jgi:signal transduction histidine kinase
MTLSFGYADLALSSLEDIQQVAPPDLQERLSQLHTSIERCVAGQEQQIQLLQALDGRGAEMFPVRLQLGDLVALVNDVVERRVSLLPPGRLQLRSHLKSADVLLDPRRIEQVFTNYLDNALSYSPPEKPVIVILVQVEQYVRVAVVDRGYGLTRRAQRRIWERGYRTQAARAQRETGSGLGLFIVRQLIERHNGHVGVQSALGQGSTFWFDLPFVDQEDTGETSPR